MLFLTAGAELLARVLAAEWLTQHLSRLQQVLCSQVLIIHGIARLDSFPVDDIQLLPPTIADWQVRLPSISIPNEDDAKLKLFGEASAVAAKVVNERLSIAAHLKPERKRRTAVEKPDSTPSLESISDIFES